MPVRPNGHSQVDTPRLYRDYSMGYKWIQMDDTLYIRIYNIYIYTVSEGNGVMVERDPTAFACASGSVA